MFYLSSYLEKNREEYYQRLQNISREGDWTGWIAFFLNAITEQAQLNSLKVKAIMGLYETMKDRIYEITHSQYGIQVLDSIFNRPIFKTSDFVKETGIHKPTALRLLRQLKQAGILTELQNASGRRPAVLCFPDLVNIAEGKSIV